MNNDQEKLEQTLEEKLNRLAQTISPGKSMVDEVMARIDRLPAGARMASGLTGGSNIRIWRTFMNSRFIKYGVAAVVLIGIIGLLIWLTSGKSAATVAFADVLKSIQTSSYTFNLSVITKEQVSTSVQTMVLEPGRLRFEQSSGPGKVSSIVDIAKGKSLILLHNQKAAIVQTLKTPSSGKSAEMGGFFTLFLNPVENLWNLRDGTEKKLARKEIDGQPVEGFKVLQDDQYFHYDTTIWANAKTSCPVLVEMIMTSLEDSSQSIKFTMSNFTLHAELDENLFSVEVPVGYTLAYQMGLDELKTETGHSSEAEKIEELLRLWSQGNKSESVEILLGIDWTKDFTFSKKPYIFTITEKQYISLKPKDQQEVMNELVATVTAVRSIAQEAVKVGVAAMSAQDYKKSEGPFDAGLQFGKLLMRNPDYMVIVRLTGIAVERDALNEMIKLYTATNDPEKLSAAKKELQAMQDEQERIKRSVSSR